MAEVTTASRVGGLAFDYEVDYKLRRNYPTAVPHIVSGVTGAVADRNCVSLVLVKIVLKKVIPFFNRLL